MSEHSLIFESGIEVELSEDTGLPLIPDNYYWEVNEGYYFGRERICISLRKSRKRWFDSTIDYRYVDYLMVEGRDRDFTLEQRILIAAGNIFMDHRGMFAPDYKREEALKLVGKYPPKQLHAERWSRDDS